jgi:hypothetical protein
VPPFQCDSLEMPLNPDAMPIYSVGDRRNRAIKDAVEPTGGFIWAALDGCEDLAR